MGYDDESPHVAKMSLDVTGFPSEDIDINVEKFVVSIKGERTNKLGDVFVLDRRFRLDKKNRHRGRCDCFHRRRNPRTHRAQEIYCWTPQDSNFCLDLNYQGHTLHKSRSRIEF